MLCCFKLWLNLLISNYFIDYTFFDVAFVQVRNLRIGVMMKTVLPALAQAIVMHSFPNFHQERTTEDLKEKLQVLYVIFTRSFIGGNDFSLFILLEIYEIMGRRTYFL